MGDPSEGSRRTAAIVGLCVLIGAPLAFALVRAEGSERGPLLLRLAVVLAVATAPPLIGRWRARRDAARGVSPASHKVTGAGLREAVAVVMGSIALVLGALLLVTSGDAYGLLGLGMGGLMLAFGLSEHRRTRRVEAATPADTTRTTAR